MMNDRFSSPLLHPLSYLVHFINARLSQIFNGYLIDFFAISRYTDNMKMEQGV